METKEKETIVSLAVYATTTGKKFCSNNCEFIVQFGSNDRQCRLFKDSAHSLTLAKDKKGRFKRLHECKSAEFDDRAGI